MAKRARRQFTDEYKAEAVSLVRTSGKTLPQVARDLDLTENALLNWVQQAQRSGEAGSGLSLSERQKLLQLRKENRVLRMERELLKNSHGPCRTRDAFMGSLGTVNAVQSNRRGRAYPFSKRSGRGLGIVLRRKRRR